MLKWTDPSMNKDLFLKQLEQSAREKKIPLNGAFELTPRCSLKCEMCYIRLDGDQVYRYGRELSADEWIDLGRQAAEMGTYNLLLTGGEVFIRRDFFRIYEALSEMGFRIFIISNATLITPEIAEQLAKRPPDEIKITLYGDSKDTYRKICGAASGYDQAHKGIENLLSVGLRPAIQTTVTCENREDAFAIAAYAVDKGLSFTWDCMLFKERKETDLSSMQKRLSPKEAAFFDAAMREHMSSLYSHKSQPQENGYKEETIVSTDLMHIADESQNLQIPCALGKSVFWITWDGKMTPCGRADFPSSNPLDCGLKEAWEAFINKCGSICIPQQCIRCQYEEYCKFCPCANAAGTGEYGQVDPYYCEYAKTAFQIKAEQGNKY
ncbi:MAG TPA: radical SAM protein [Syntrophomonadaceae bacterium]|nr:radical SAM protein [Syntrophomonadaceae bacterium]